MANYANLLATIAANIYTNSNQEVTAAMAKAALDAMVGSLGVGFQFMGIATPDTDPGTPDQRVFYIATDGVFTNFGGIEIDAGAIGFLKYDTEWSVDIIEGLGSAIFQVANVAEDGLYFVDSSMNVGAQLTQDGFNSFNSLNFRTL